MKKVKCALLLLLAVALLMSGCALGTKAEETVAPTAAPTMAPTEVPTEAPTEAPTEPEEPGLLTLKETVFPEKDAATGTLKFYIKGKEVYAGGPVSNLLDAGVTTYENLKAIVQPWHMTSVLRVRVEMEDTEEADLPFVFFIAMNASNEPKMVSECLLYSVTINTDDGVLFGSGKEAVPFITGETTLDEILNAYGEPDYNVSGHADYREIAYYEPFNCAYFSFHHDVVRQVTTYYSANVFGDLAETFNHDFGASYFGNDAFILMNQYMDVTPYLPGAEGNVTSGVLEALTESITMGGQVVEMGMRVEEMPSPFVDQFIDQLMYLVKHYYVRVGRNLGEEFYVINHDGQSNNKKGEQIANKLLVKGVFTENRNYRNWGIDNEIFHEFQYENLTHESTIEDILEQYGMPYDIDCTSNARNCFVWMYYKDQNENTLEIRVDPILNQLVELRFSKYFEDELFYP